ncbi:MAG: alpha/beta fold hydrolase [Granulosicoccus sp.]
MKGYLPDRWLEQACAQGMLSVGSEHELHWRAYGDKSLAAVLFLHGGPGSGVDLSSLCFFDPELHYVIMFDQRGSGQSTPSGSLVDNTTSHLLTDIELLRKSLDINQWIVFGGSWGATLGLLYAQSFPSSCTGLVLRGISNSHLYQNRWMLEERPLMIPDRYQAFLKGLGDEQCQDPVKAHYLNIISDDVNRQLLALNAINILESGAYDAEPEPLDSCEDLVESDLDDDHFNRAKIYLHYWVNKKFLTEAQCLPEPSALDGLNTIFVHGESDWICPLSGAQEIVACLPKARLITVQGAGHSPFNPAMTKMLKDCLAELIQS